MADPASVLSLISTSLTITIRAATIGKDLHTLIQKYKTTNAKVRQLSVHVSAIRVAARSLSSWLEEDAVGSEEVEDVKRELLEVLSACCDLLSDLQDHVANALAGAESVGFKGVLAYIWDEDVINATVETLHHQETVLILMLQTLGQFTRIERSIKLREPTVVDTFTKAKRPSSSIFGLRTDNRSSMRFSYSPESSEKIDTTFTFDLEVMASTAYRNAFTTLVKRNMANRVELYPDSVRDEDPVAVPLVLTSKKVNMDRGYALENYDPRRPGLNASQVEDWVNGIDSWKPRWFPRNHCEPLHPALARDVSNVEGEEYPDYVGSSDEN